MGNRSSYPGISTGDLGIADVLADLIEFGIDKSVNNEMIDMVPIVKSVHALAKTVNRCRGTMLQKQTELFVKELNAQTIAPEKLQQYRDRLEHNPSFLEAETSRVLFALSTSYDAEKAIMLARIYAEYVKGTVNWNECQELIEIVTKLFVGDLPILKEIAAGQVKETTIETQHVAGRLSGLGILSLRLKSMTMYPGSISPSDDQAIEITSIGKKFIRCVRL